MNVVVVPLTAIGLGGGGGNGDVAPFTGFGDAMHFGVKLSSIFGGGIALPV